MSESKVPPGSEEVIANMMHDERFPDPESALASKEPFELSEKTREALSKLTPVGEKVMRMRLSIGEKTDHTSKVVDRRVRANKEK